MCLIQAMHCYQWCFYGYTQCSVINTWASKNWLQKMSCNAENGHPVSNFFACHNPTKHQIRCVSYNHTSNALLSVIFLWLHPMLSYKYMGIQKFIVRLSWNAENVNPVSNFLACHNPTKHQIQALNCDDITLKMQKCICTNTDRVA